MIEEVIEKSEWEDAFLLESRVAQIISTQAKHGCNFDRKKASFGIHILTERIINIDKKLIPMLPPMMNKGNAFAKPFLKSGKFTKFVQAYADQHELTREEIGGPFTRVWYTPFDASKTEKLKLVMVKAGWIPAVWNNKKSPLEEIQHLPPAQRVEAEKTVLNAYINKNILGNGPEFTDLILNAYRYKKPRTIKNLKEFLKKEKYWITGPKITPDEDQFSGDSEMLDLIRERMIWSHRRSLLQGLLKMERADGKLSGEANPCATPTARMKHKIIKLL